MGLATRSRGTVALRVTRKPWLLCCRAALLGGCAMMVPPPEPVGELAAVNPRYGYRFANLAKGPDNSDGIFMVLAFSGGGTSAPAGLNNRPPNHSTTPAPSAPCAVRRTLIPTWTPARPPVGHGYT